MTGEELLFLVWLFLGFLLLAYTTHYIYRQMMIERYSEFRQAIAHSNRVLKRLQCSMKTIYWADHINIPEAYRTAHDPNKG